MTNDKLQMSNEGKRNSEEKEILKEERNLLETLNERVHMLASATITRPASG